MARYQVMYWKHIPTQVKAGDERGEVRRMLPDRFMAAVDAYAMGEGSTGSEAYLEGWHWSETAERAGTAADVADALVAELDRDHPRARLMERR